MPDLGIPIHARVHPKDLRMLAALTNSIYNNVHEPLGAERTVRASLEGGDAASKVQLLKDVAADLVAVAETIETESQEGTTHGPAERSR